MMDQHFQLSRPFDVSTAGYGGNQMWFQKQHQLQTGCGPVALTNLFAWFHGMSLSREDMEALQDVTTRYLKGPVVHPRQFIFGARRLFRRDGFHLDPIHMTVFRSTPDNQDRLRRFIAVSLQSDDPVALLMGPNLPGSTYRRDFKNHWVLITAMEISKGTVTLTVSSWGTPYTVDLDQLTRSKLFLSLVSLRVREKPLDPS